MSAFRARIAGFTPCLVAMLVCFLVWTQFSGLHLHLPEGESPHVHAAHAPGHGDDGHHDDMGEFDVSPVSLVKQILSFPLALITLCLLFLWAPVGRRMPVRADIPLFARPWLHFIPPLRGPPATV